jgi:hypothetical protein
MTKTGILSHLRLIRRFNLSGPKQVNDLIKLIEADKLNDAVIKLKSLPDFKAGLHAYSWSLIDSGLNKLTEGC